MVQCNYCDYTTTADEYGLIDGPKHLVQKHNTVLDSIDDIRYHFHSVRVEI